MLRKLLLSLPLLLLASVVHAQGTRYDGIALRSNGTPAPFANVAVFNCTGPGACSTVAATLYTDITVTTSTGTNQLQADGLGNFHFYAKNGRYGIQTSGVGIITFQQNDIVLPCDPSTTCGIANFSADNLQYVSPSGSDSNNGQSWGAAKLTPQAAMNAATATGTKPGTVYVACGTYPGPPASVWLYPNTNWISACGAPVGAICGTVLCGPNNGYSATNADSIFQYSTALSIGPPASGNLLNISVKGIIFDFQNNGVGLTFSNVAGFKWEEDAVIHCGNTTTPCVTLTATSTGFNTTFNTFRDFYINPNSANSQYASCMLLQGSGSVLGPGVYDNTWYNLNCTGQINDVVDFEKNSDSNFIYGVRVFQSLGAAVANSCYLCFNLNTPASDQDAGNGAIIMGANLTGPITNAITMGQTTGAQISYETGASGITPNVIGGTPLYSLSVIPVTAGVKPTQTVFGSISTQRFYNGQGTQLTTGAFSFNSGWGTSPSFTSVRGTDSGYDLVLAAGSGSPTADPTITFTYADGAWNNSKLPICQAQGVDVTASPSTAQPFFVSDASTATQQTLVFMGTPTASHSYQIHVSCSGSPN